MRFLLFLAAALVVAACAADEPDQPVADQQQPAQDAPAEPEPDEGDGGEEGDDDGDPATFSAPEVIADDPAGLAEQLVATEQRIRDEAVDTDALADTGHLHQLVYRRLAADPELAEATLAQVGEPWQAVAEANLAAGRALLELHAPGDALPPWRIVAPPPADELLGHYQEAEATFGVPWAYLAAVHLVETRMSRIDGDSVAGAQGPMQFIPATWAQYGEGDVRDDRDAILAAGRYLSARGAPGDMDAALYAYNNSSLYVAAVRAYAERMLADPAAFRGYYHWQVYYRTADDEHLLEVGYDGT